jgi:hypothetical protein
MIKTFKLTALGLFAGLAASAQTTGLLNVLTVHCKMDRWGEFEAGARRVAAANRAHKGSNWIALQMAKGEGATYLFVSVEDNFAAMQKSGDAFSGAVAATIGGMDALPKFFQDLDKNLSSMRSEVRRRRPDLGSNLPADADAVKAAGKLRFLGTTTVRLRPGTTRDYEQQIKLLGAASAKESKQSVYISQSALGTAGTVFYISRYFGSMAELDEQGPGAAKLLGEAGYQKYLDVLKASVISTESDLYQVRPDLSNPPDAVAAVDPSFWRPKAMAPAAKPAAAAPKKDTAQK